MSVLNSLGINNTFFTQFFITVAALYLMQQFFVHKLIDVVILRSTKTVGAEQEYERLVAENLILNSRYAKLIGEKVSAIDAEYNQSKQAIIKEKDDNYKLNEKIELDNLAFYTKSKQEQIDQLESQVINSIGSLANDLTTKLAK
jgi:hypothetical protein